MWKYVSKLPQNSNRDDTRQIYLQATSNLEYSLFITSLAIIPSNENIVSGSIKGSINVWNSTTFQLIATFQAHTDLVQSPFGPSNFK